MARAANQARVPREIQPGSVQHQFIIFDDMPKMNTKPMRQNLSEKEAYWIENLQPIAGNDLKVVPAPLEPPDAVLPGKVVARMFPAAILADIEEPNGPLQDLMIFFATDGSGTAINIAAGTTTEFAPPGTFSTTPDMTVWSDERILIADPQAGYVTWDGHVLVSSGGVSPAIDVTNGGTGYSSPPTVIISGGGGSGATAHAVMGGDPPNEFVAHIVLDTPGTGYTSNPTVTITGGGGSGATATGRLWPQSGLPNLGGQPQPQISTIAVFAGRVWTARRRVLEWTGTNGFDDTDPANTAGSLTITDADLVHEITALRSLNNFLYIFGDQSIKQIGSVSIKQPATGTTGQATAEFTILTLSSDVGTWFMMTILSYNRTTLFCNKHGVYAIFGASVQKISDDLDGIFPRVDWSQEPCAALNDLNNIHCYLLLLRYLDPNNEPVLGVAPQGGVHPRSIICTFATRAWFITTQGNDLLSIASAPLEATEELETFGSSGADFTFILSQPDVAVQWILKTALTAHGNIIVAKQAIKSGVAISAQEPQTFTMLVESENKKNSYTLFAAGEIIWRNANHDIITFTNSAGGQIRFMTGPGFKLPYRSADAYGRVLGATLFATSKNMAINAVMIEYIDADLWGILP